METKHHNSNAAINSPQADGPVRGRAKLKIFFGMAPGVGKTYAMLEAAQDRLDEGVDVVIGAIETHDRPETLALLAGLKHLPKRALPYRGVMVDEFDLQQAIARKPQLILMDDLAHSNTLGSIHAKRWQDVWDLLDAGIDVYTTVNVQHIESLKDVITHITGILVRDTVPDTILARADEIELVDLPPEELIQRLKEGKISIPEQNRHAMDRFFRKGNLLALRELALRKTADHVDDDMRRYMTQEHIGQTWATNERLLVCISPSESSANLIRATHRLAERIKAPWIVAYVEVGKLKHSQKERTLVEEHLRLAERLGGETVVVQGDVSLAEDLVSLAVTRNVTRILVGKPKGSRLVRAIRPSLVDRLVNLSESIDVMVIARENDIGVPSVPREAVQRPSAFSLIRHMGLTILSVALATGVALFMKHQGFELADFAMLYVLDILVVGYRFGLWPAAIASVLSALCLDFFFVAPFYHMGFSNGRHIGTFLVMLTVGLVIGNLAERIRAQIRLASERERRTLSLFNLAAEFAQGGASSAIVEVAIRNLAAQFQGEVGIFLPDAKDNLVSKAPFLLSEEEHSAAQWAFEHGEPSGRGTDTLPEVDALVLPLKSAREGLGATLGVIVMRPMTESLDADSRHLLDAFANQTALALERSLLAEKNIASQRRIDQEHHRSALLPAVSKHLQGPLESILDICHKSQSSGDGLLEEIRLQAFGIQRLVANLLILGRMESSAMVLHRKEISAKGIVDKALKRLSDCLEGREVKVDLPLKLPEAWVDGELSEQMLLNVLDNAARFSPSGLPIEIGAWSTDKALTIVVRDYGPGLPEGLEDRIFEKLVRADNACGKAGAGLGLAICKGIAQAQGGWIQGSNHPGGGAQFLISLPLKPKAEQAQED